MSENYEFMASLAQKDVEVLKEKGKHYGPSWKQRGGVGAFMMLARKWDRIHNWCEANGWDIFKIPREMVINDIGDLRRYLLLVETHIVTGNSFPVITEPHEALVSAKESIMSHLKGVKYEQEKPCVKVEPREDADAPNYYSDHHEEENVVLVSTTLEAKTIRKMERCMMLMQILNRELDECNDYINGNEMLTALTKMEIQISEDINKLTSIKEDKLMASNIGTGTADPQL